MFPPLFLVFTWVNKLNCALLRSSAAVCASNLLESFVGVNALLDCVHELAHVNELITANLIILIEELLGDVALCELEVASTLRDPCRGPQDLRR